MKPEALSSWQVPKRRTRGDQPRYSDLATETALTLGLVLGLLLRHTEGFVTSVLKLIGPDLAVPDHTTLSRPASKSRVPNKRPGDRIPEKGPVHVLIYSTGLQVYGVGQWLEDKHGVKLRRGWRKPHLALDADSGDIVAHVMADQEAADPSQVGPLLDQIDTPIGQFAADGTYDGDPTYGTVTNHSPDAAVIIPPCANAVDRKDTYASSQRARHIAAINAYGRMKWACRDRLREPISGLDGDRSLQSIIGRRLRAGSFATQQTEVVIGYSVLNRMLACARTKSIRCKTGTA